MNSKVKICDKTLGLLLLNKFIIIFLFALIYSVSLYFVSLFLDGGNLLLSAIIILGFLGIIYNGLKLYIVNNFKKFTNEIPIKIIKSCIGKSRSLDYGNYVYFPVIEYEYTLKDKKVVSDIVYWDFDSFFYNRGVIGGLTEEASFKYAENILNTLKNKKIAYFMKFDNKVYLDIVLSENRKRYFRNQISLSVILIVISAMYLL